MESIKQKEKSLVEEKFLIFALHKQKLYYFKNKINK